MTANMHTTNRQEHVLEMYLRAGSVEDAAQWLLEEEAGEDGFESTSDMEIAYSDLCAEVRQALRDAGEEI